MKRIIVSVGLAVGIVGVLLLSLAIGGYIQTIAAKSKGSPAPAGLKKYIVFMADGALGPNALPSISGDAFQREIMKRTPAEIEAHKAKAKQYFLEQFGLDFSRAQTVNGVEVIDEASLSSYQFNPQQHYRAYTVSGEAVPSEGWEVRDGGYVLFLTKDTVLHGRYGGAEGKAARASEWMIYGEYNIAAPNQPIVVQYESPMPMLYDPHMGMVIDCDLHSAEWGDGKGYGAQAMTMALPDGKNIIPTRNILTFPSQ